MRCSTTSRCRSSGSCSRRPAPVHLDREDGRDLSEAAVRQRVQRLLDAGVMQIVAVTDPLQRRPAPPSDGRHPGRRRRPRARGASSPHPTRSNTSSSARARTTSSSSSTARDDEHLLEVDQHADPFDPGHPLDRDLRVPPAREADLYLGNVMTATSPHRRTVRVRARNISGCTSRGCRDGQATSRSSCAAKARGSTTSTASATSTASRGCS